MKNYSIVSFTATSYYFLFYDSAILPRLISHIRRWRKIEIRQLTPYRRFTDAEHETMAPAKARATAEGGRFIIARQERVLRGEWTRALK